MKVNWAILPKSIVVNFNGKTKNISNDNKEIYDRVVEAIRSKNYDSIPGILDIIGTISVKSNKNIEIKNDSLYIDGDLVNNSIAARILQYHRENLPYDGLVEFWRNLKQNPSYMARERLFFFLENGGHPFTDDGHFIAYKAVTSDFKDIRTKTFDNSIGAKPSMDRSQISDDPNVHCDPGLHVASFKYLTDSGYYTKTNDNVYIYVKVNPKNVVSIPTDYHNQKMRVCEYEVLGISESPLTLTHYSTPKPVVPEPVAPITPDPVWGEPVAVDSSSDEESSSSESEPSSSESEEETPTPPVVVVPSSDSSSSTDSDSSESENKDSETDEAPPAFLTSEDNEEYTEESSSSEEY